MNIRQGKVVSLNESQQNIQQAQQQNVEFVAENQEAVIFNNQTKQFKFDCGVFMAGLTATLNTKFSLVWHYTNTKDFDSFVKSVETFLSSTNNKLTDGDINRLKASYDIKSKVK